MLVPALQDADDRVRWIAAETLGVLAVEAKTVIPLLIAMLKSETKRIAVDDEYVAIRSFDEPACRLGPNKQGDPIRIAAIQALGSFGDATVPALPALIGTLRDPDLRVRWFAAEALARIGPAAKSAVPALIEAIRCKGVAEGAGDPLDRQDEGEGMEDGPIRLAAAMALGKIGPAANSAVPDLIAALSDPDSRVRGEAARALGAIGREAAAAAPELVRLATRSPGGTVADLCREASIQLGPASVPVLLNILRDRDPDTRLAAISLSGGFEDLAAGAIPELIGSLNDRDPEMRAAAAGAGRDQAGDDGGDPSTDRRDQRRRR